jgi:sRNA-binding carbon storage regulator CsrA
MLVLAMQKEERILISLPDGREVWLQIVQIDHGRVRIGFAAPRDIVIDRETVVRQKRNRIANEEAKKHE